MKKYFTRDNVVSPSIPEDWHKLKNFQTVRPLTLQQQIERFQAAGRKLNELQGLGVYDFNENQPLDDELEDPTRDPDFDAIDAAVALRDIALRNQSAEADGTATQSPGGENSSNTQVNDETLNKEPPTEGAQQPTPAGE